MAKKQPKSSGLDIEDVMNDIDNQDELKNGQYQRKKEIGTLWHLSLLFSDGIRRAGRPSSPWECLSAYREHCCPLLHWLLRWLHPASCRC